MSAQHDLTKNQEMVLGTLSAADGPLSAYTILDRLRDRGFRAPLQVYRALDKLLDYGLIHRLESINSFVACAHPQCHGHGSIAFAICEKCGQVEEFSDAMVQQHLSERSRERGFKPSKTVIEIRGTCAACLAA
jgi:Fur family transcriptional regulator, zinc uptake regulator